MNERMDEIEFGAKCLGAVLILWAVLALAGCGCHCKKPAAPVIQKPETHSCTTDPFTGKVICK